LFGLEKTKAPFVLFLDADDELKPGALVKIIDRLDPGVAKLQFPLTRIDTDGNIISAALPALDTFRDRHVLARQVLRRGVYRSPPTSGNVFRRDVCKLLREADYDKFVDGVILFAAPFLAMSSVFPRKSDAIASTATTIPAWGVRRTRRLSSATSREAGCAVVATDVDGIPERLEYGKAGILVPARDPARLSEVLCSLVANSETLREWRQKSQFNVEHLRIERVARETLEVYAAASHRVRGQPARRA